jgi:hypothetical protein
MRLAQPSAAVALATAVLGASGASAQNCTLAGLAWMAGAWRADGPTTRSEERWVAGPGGRLIGSSWLLHTDGPGGLIEANSIQEDAGSIILRLRHFNASLTMAREEKDAPMAFIAARCAPGEAVFDGQGPQAGEHMTYRRAGEKLTFIGDFIHAGQPIRAEIAFRLTGD